MYLRVVEIKSFMSLLSFYKKFTDEDACIKHLRLEIYL